MVPNKFEKQIRDQINSREIQPSEAAWDRLDAMLSVTEEKKTKRSFGWLYIAASILVLLTAGLFFINQNTTTINPSTTIVINEEEKDSVVNPSNQIQENAAPIEKMQPLVQVEENVNSSSKNRDQRTDNRQPTTNNRVSIIKQNQSTKINTISQNQEVIAEKMGQSQIENRSLVIDKSTSIKNVEIVAKTETKTTTSSKVTVSASSLLSQVDGELELTFREKVFKKVAKNYKEVKVVLANRNTLE